jgi:hypothetical protein
MTVVTDVADLRLTAADWAAAVDAREPGTPHNEARDQIWDELLTILTEPGAVPDASPAVFVHSGVPASRA